MRYIMMHGFSRVRFAQSLVFCTVFCGPLVVVSSCSVYLFTVYLFWLHFNIFKLFLYVLFGWFMVFNATFNNIFVFQLYYMVAVSFIGGGNRSTYIKPPTCRKSLTNLYHIMKVVSSLLYHEWGSNSELEW